MIMIGIILGPVNKTFLRFFRPPIATTGTEDSEALLDDIVSRKVPSIQLAQKRSLIKDNTYNLLDQSVIKVVTKNADGESCDFEVIKVEDPDNDIVNISDYTKFTPEKAGRYKITYRVYEYYTTLQLFHKKISYRAF